jgi:hypothetical protein
VGEVRQVFKIPGDVRRTMRIWVVHYLGRRPVTESPTSRPLASVLREVPGCWVAVDRTTGEPVAVEDTPYKLSATIRSRQIKNVAVVRSPDPSEPELVGLG